MDNSKSIILSSSYFGSIEYYAQLVNTEKVTIDPNEHYIKQTYRNRCIIETASGPFPLIIPVTRPNGNHTKLKDIVISNAEGWQKLHWRAIMTAYSNSPFLLFYQDELEPFYQKKFKFLFDFNQQLQEIMLGFLKAKKSILVSDSYLETFDSDTMDLRNAFSPKRKSESNFLPYIQVFEEKHGFLPNLSILDLLLNEGPASSDYLIEIGNNW